MEQNKNFENENEEVKADFEEVKLTDCDVPINCPFGLDLAEDAFPDHH
ncbi:hypothetical protein IMSAGC011_01354 [Lachnospiraceae bacterium]|nr:hypothetical protein IMSAGC011_01354 [Lachnospiraceae bacterium]